MSIIYLDYETYSPVDIKTQGTYNYLNHKEAKIICTAYAIDDGEVVIGTPTITKNDRLVVCNSFFEYCVLRLILKEDVEAIQMIDIIALGGQLGLSTGLATMARILGVEGKLDSGKKLINRDDLTSKELKELQEYCKQDVAATRECFKKLQDFKLYTNKEHLIASQTLDMNFKGIPVSRELIELCVEKRDYAMEIIHKDFINLTSALIKRDHRILDTSKWKSQKAKEKHQAIFQAGFDHNKKGRLRELLGLDTLDSRKWGQIDKIVVGYGDDDKSNIWETYKKISFSSIAKISTALGYISEDGRIRGTLIYHGAHSGRYTSKGYQMHNMPRKVNGHNDEETLESIENLRECTDPYKIYDYLSGMIRHFIHTKKGLCIFDYKSIELYVGRALVGEPILGDKDGYKEFACAMFNIDYDSVTKEQRNRAKMPCLSAETKVTTKEGVKFLIDITPEDKVWNGKSWVNSEGVISKGIKKVITYKGITGTKDHRVLQYSKIVELSKAKDISCQLKAVQDSIQKRVKSFMSGDF